MKENMKKMWREHKLMLVITSCVILLQTVVGVILWDRLPEQIATHFGLNGQPDGYSGRTFTVFGMPLVLLALHWVCLLISGKDGKRCVFAIAQKQARRKRKKQQERQISGEKQHPFGG